jgi:hypothetical protein
MAYLGTTSGVLGGTTGDQLSVTGEQVLVDTHVLVLSKDSIILLQTILLEESGITNYEISIKINSNLLLNYPYPRAWMSITSGQHYPLSIPSSTYRGEGSPDREEGNLEEQPL